MLSMCQPLFQVFYTDVLLQSLQQPYEAGTIIVLILKSENWSIQRLNKLSRSLSYKRQSWDLNPGSSSLASTFYTVSQLKGKEKYTKGEMTTRNQG